MEPNPDFADWERTFPPPPDHPNSCLPYEQLRQLQLAMADQAIFHWTTRKQGAMLSLLFARLCLADLPLNGYISRASGGFMPSITLLGAMTPLAPTGVSVLYG